MSSFCQMSSAAFENVNNVNLEAVMKRSERTFFSKAAGKIKKMLRRLCKSKKASKPPTKPPGSGLQVVTSAEELQNAINEALESRASRKLLLIVPPDFEIDFKGQWTSVSLQATPGPQTA